MNDKSLNNMPRRIARCLPPVMARAAFAGVACLALLSVPAPAEVLYEDDCEGDFASRYTVNSGGFAYKEAPGGGRALTPTTGGAWNWITSTSYEGGDFTNTAIEASFRVFNHDLKGQQTRLVLLADGFIPDKADPRRSHVAGYSFMVYPYGNHAGPSIARNNPDGTVTQLLDNIAGGPEMYPAGRSGYWEHWTATVEVRDDSTDLTLTWEGDQGNGENITYEWRVSDFSPGRLKKGAGFGLMAYPGDMATGVSIDQLKIKTLPALPELGNVKYGIASWPASGRGNHRAVVEVTGAADAVRARIPWRRHDADFRNKAVRVYDLATGEEIRNVLACNITREHGDVVFQPGTVPGRYAVYYLPYNPAVIQGGRWDEGYLPPKILAGSGWLARHGLQDAASSFGGIRFLPTRRLWSDPYLVAKEGENGALGSPFEIVAGSAVDFAGNDYVMDFEVGFPGHKGPNVQPTVLPQDDGRGYDAQVYNYAGRLVMGITRQDAAGPDGAKPAPVELVKANFDDPWPVDMNQPIHVTVSVKVLPDRTVVTSQATGTGHDGKPFSTPLLKAEDASPERLAGGRAPVFANVYEGDDQAGFWVRNIVIRDRAGKTVFDSAKARRGATVENTAALDDAALDALPQARLVRMEARRARHARPEMNAFYPMEVIASRSEVSALLEKHPGQTLLFPEDRRRPVVMPDFLPWKWALDGPQGTFAGQCQPGEYYCWQIGVYAAREDIESLSLEFSDVRDASGQTVIPAREITCFNLGGIDHNAKPFTREFKLGKGKVRPLWIGMMVPDSAKGKLSGAVKVKINGHPAQTVGLALDVDGPVIANHGDDEPWRHSRLRWLNSTLGQDENALPPPFTAVRREGSAIGILNRTITPGPEGLPARIVSNGQDVLAAPVRMEVLDADGRALAFTAGATKVEMETPSRRVESVQSSGGPVGMTTRSETWFDGTINVEVVLRSDKDAVLKDVALVIPLNKDVAQYFAGMSYRDGRRPDAWQWKWDRRYSDNGAWCGGVEAGLGLALLGERDYYDTLRWDEHPQWINDGKGGATLAADGEAAVLRAFTGEKTLAAGEPLKLRFRLYVTPFKPLRPDHWNLRYKHNIPHFHHGCPKENHYINYPFMAVDLLKKAYDENTAKGNSRMLTVYYTLRELSNIAPELFAFRSFGDEILRSSGAYVYSPEGAFVAGEGGGHPWLREHLGDGYSPAWQHALPMGEVDAAVATKGDGRLMNYYIEGLAYLQKKIGSIGVYLDGIAYDRIGMMRLARTLSGEGRDYYLNFHVGDAAWGSDNRGSSPLVLNMEHLPFLTQLMLGEFFWYDGPEGYWMTQLAGLPFGIDNQFYPIPGPDYPFRAMLYASAPIMEWKPPLPYDTTVATDIRAFWDRWGINEHTKTLGYWDKKCPVRTNARDIHASVYTNEGKALVCVGSWAKETTPVTLAVDWQALGMDPATTRVTLPDIGSLQKPQDPLDLTRPIPIEPGKGVVIGLEKQPPAAR